MAHKSPDAGNGAASGLHSEKSKAIAMDVKMQIRILEAKLLFLHEKNAITPEIEELISSFTAVMKKINPYSKVQPPTEVPKQTARVLGKPMLFNTKSRRALVDAGHLNMEPGQPVQVHAWKNNEKSAVVFFLHTYQAGEISSECLDLTRPKRPESKMEIIMSTKSRNGGKDLSWKAWELIRVCRWEVGEKYAFINGVGFNLATMEIGQLNAPRSAFVIIRRGDYPIDE